MEIWLDPRLPGTTIYETCFVFQACLIKRSSYWQQFKANSATQWHCDYFHFLTSAGGDLPPKHLSLVFFVSLGSMPLNAKGLVLYLGFLTYTLYSTPWSCHVGGPPAPPSPAVNINGLVFTLVTWPMAAIVFNNDVFANTNTMGTGNNKQNTSTSNLDRSSSET